MGVTIATSVIQQLLPQQDPLHSDRCDHLARAQFRQTRGVRGILEARWIPLDGCSALESRWADLGSHGPRCREDQERVVQLDGSRVEGDAEQHDAARMPATVIGLASRATRSATVERFTATLALLLSACTRAGGQSARTGSAASWPSCAIDAPTGDWRVQRFESVRLELAVPPRYQRVGGEASSTPWPIVSWRFDGSPQTTLDVRRQRAALSDSGLVRWQAAEHDARVCRLSTSSGPAIARTYRSRTSPAPDGTPQWRNAVIVDWPIGADSVVRLTAASPADPIEFLQIARTVRILPRLP